MTLGWALWAVAAPARAADCADAYPVDRLIEDLVSVETFLRNGDDDNAGKAAALIEGGLPCMQELLPRMITGRAYRAVGGGLVASGQVERGVPWLETAAEIEQSFQYGLEDLPEVHPVRTAWSDAVMSPDGSEIPVAGATLGAATVYLDGRKLVEPKARPARPHLVQTDDGTLVRSYVVDGNALPEEALAAAPVVTSKKSKPEKAPKPTAVAAAPEPEPEPRMASPKPAKPAPAKPLALSPTESTIVKRQRPWEKTPLMLGGGAVLAGAGAVYYLSVLSLQKFEGAQDDAELPQLQQETNQLYIASLAVAALGVGTMTWGVILDGHGAPIPSVRVRF